MSEIDQGDEHIIATSTTDRKNIVPGEDPELDAKKGAGYQQAAHEASSLNMVNYIRGRLQQTYPDELRALNVDVNAISSMSELTKLKDRLIEYQRKQRT